MKWSDIPKKLGGIFLPYTLLCVSVIAYLYWQLGGISDQRTVLNLQILSEGPGKDQAAQDETKLKNIVSDLLAVANQGDSTAIALVKKFNISQQAPTPPKN